MVLHKNGFGRDGVTEGEHVLYVVCITREVDTNFCDREFFPITYPLSFLLS